LLAEYFLKTFAQTHNKHLHGFTLGFQQALAEHHWPGNVRELQNVIERSLVLADDDEHLGVKDLPQELQGGAIPEELPEEFPGSFHQSVRAFKRELVRSALRMHAGNKVQAARKLGISRCYLHRLLNQLSIAPVALEADSEETESQAVPVPRSRSGDLGSASRVA
jgi:transcriptional regulator with PAS, ATPase and Fis domain